MTAIIINYALSAMMLSVVNKAIMLSVIVLKVMAPQVGEPREFWQTKRKKNQCEKKFKTTHIF
jgi:hypothetical protein